MKPLNPSYFKPKLYLSAKVRAENHARNNTVASYLRGLFDIFLPHAHQSGESNHEDLPLSVYNMDITAMSQTELAVLVPPFGSDCSYEIGWFVAKKVPVFMYVQDDLQFLSNAMVVGGVTAVFTDNTEVFNRLMRQPVLKSKTFFLSEPRSLGKRVLSYYNELNNGKILMEHS